MHGRKIPIPSARFRCFSSAVRKFHHRERKREREREIQASANRRGRCDDHSSVAQRGRKYKRGNPGQKAASRYQTGNYRFKSSNQVSPRAFRANERRGIDASIRLHRRRGAACTPGYLRACISYVRVHTSYTALQQFRRANAKLLLRFGREVETVMRTPTITCCALRVH